MTSLTCRVGDERIGTCCKHTVISTHENNSVWNVAIYWTFHNSVNDFHWATMTIKGSLQTSIPLVKAFLAGFWSKIWLGHVTCENGFVDDPMFKFPDPDLPIYYAMSS